MSENPQSPNVATLQTGLGRSSRRTGNRIDRYAERTWITRQQITFPYGAIPIAISVARTYYTRAFLLGLLYLGGRYQIIVPGAFWFTLGAYTVWEAIMFTYLLSSGAPKFDLSVRTVIAGAAIPLVYFHLFEGLCGA